MPNNIYKLIIISFLFISPLDSNQKIMLDELDVITTLLPLPYNGKVYAPNDLNEFIFNAIRKDKQPIIIFGANWCPDCRYFSGNDEYPKN